MHKSAILLALIVSLAGCESSSQNSDGPGASTAKRNAVATRNTGSGKNCELKNPTGTGPCEDPRGSKAKTSSASARSERPFRPSDCTSYGFDGYFLLAELGHRMKEWKAYCAEQEAAQSADQPSSRQNETTGDGGTGGTWYCDTTEGSGMYGRYGMRDLPNIDASTCKKVSD